MTRPKTAPARTTPKSIPEFEVSIEVMSWLKEDFNYRGPGGLAFKEVVRRGTSVMDIIRRLADEFPKFGKKAFAQKHDMNEYCMVIRNGLIISPAELSQELRPGDKIALTPAFYGG